MEDEPRPARTYPLGWITDAPGPLPTPAEFETVKRERCRLLLAATRVKALAADVYAEFGDAARPVLARKGLTVADDGTIVSEEEAQVGKDWIAIVAALDIAGVKLKLPCDTAIDPATGCVVVTPHPHESYGAYPGGRAVSA